MSTQPTTYTISVHNTGTVERDYIATIPNNQAPLGLSFSSDTPHQLSRFVTIEPQTTKVITLWHAIPITVSNRPSKTVLIKVSNRYGVEAETTLTLATSVFQEINGQVVLESEYSGSKPPEWRIQTSLAEYIGSGYMTAVSSQPDYRLVLTSALEYPINFRSPGSYTVWLRGYAPNGTGDSVYVSLDNNQTTPLTGFAPRRWDWSRQSIAGTPVKIVVNQAGVHTLQISPRERGLRLDRILLTTDSSYTPSQNGPPENGIQK